MKFIIKRKTLIAMLFTGLTMLGYFSYKNLPVELFPNAELPMMFVQIMSPLEVDPKYMENQAIIPLEGAISTLEGIEELKSFSNTFNGSITISYNQKTNIKYAYLKLLEKIESVKPNLPEGFRVEVIKISMDQINNLLMNLQVRGGGGIDRVRTIVDQEIKAELESINGIAKVEVFGGQQKSVEIILNEKKCKAVGITVSQVRNIIIRNQKTRTFVGKAIENNKRFFVNVSADYVTISDIEGLVVLQNGPIRLRDISEIHFGVKKQESLSRVNGKDAVTIMLTRDSQTNMIDLSHKTLNVIDKLNKELNSKDIEIIVENNMAETMEDNINAIIQLALIGGLLAIFLMWVFLKNIRLVLVIAFAIPISVFSAFNFFYAFDISINSLTLIGMALAIGMLLDNSIVVLENIYRLASRNRNPDETVIQGTKEVWRSIIAGTLTTITVFLPFIFAQQFLVKKIGYHIGVSIISTLLVSLFIALLLIPMITHSFLKRKKGKKPPVFEKVSIHNRLIQIYLLLLKTSLRKPARTIIGAVFIFFITIIICLALGTNTLREADTPDFNIYVNMPAGSTLDNTDDIVASIEEKLEDITEKKDLISNIYEDEAILTFILKDNYKQLDNRTLPQIKSDIQNRVKGLQANEISFEPPQSSQRFGGGGGGGQRGPGGGIERILGIGTQSEMVVVKGEDFDRMRAIAEDIQYYLEDLSSISSVSIGIASNRPEIHLHFDKLLMAQYGISLNSVNSELNSFRNEFSSGAIFKQGTEEYDIIIKSDQADEKKDRDIDDLKQMEVPGTEGVKHELQNISQIIYADGLSSINRVNQEKQIEITYRFLNEVNDSKELLEASRYEIDQLIEGLNLPSGIALEVVHEDNDLGEYKFLIIAAIILIFMILASVFESFTTPIVLLFSIPLAATGSFVALIFTGNSILNVNTLTGFIILLGVVVNNGIILIDYTKILRQRGYSRPRALMTAGLGRVRPILITAITTIIALFPMAMGNKEYAAAIGVPFAVTVIGGLSLSTILTLVFIPTLNSGLESAITWMRNLNRWVKLAQLAALIVFGYLIYTEVDKIIYQLLMYFMIIVLIPGVTFFIKKSLRQANEKLIPENEPLNIKIRNLVKIYDRDSRFVREWKMGLKIRKRSGLHKSFKSWRDFDQLIWQAPLIGFIVYFIYFYLQKGFWFLFLPFLLYFLILNTWKPIRIYLKHLAETRKKKIYRIVDSLVYTISFWAFPAVTLGLYLVRYDTFFAVFIGILWYLGIIIYTLSNRHHSNKVDINNISGLFGGLRRRSYRAVLAIPLIGKKKTPFKALKSVSLEIETGMFGLLGPNGAGKTTLMRIICGILEQSYGKITINGIDTMLKREELQGLIGYLPQEFGMYENMTAFDFLNYQAILKKILDNKQREERVDNALKAVHMYDQRNNKISSYSGGMKQRIGIAQILLHLPRILVVDEPTAGLDPRERIRFRNLLVELSRERVVIFSTHIIEDISSSCNRVAVLKKGEIKYLGEPVHMTQIAEGKVWQLNIPAAKFDEFQKTHYIIHHMRDGDNIRVRCISDSLPYENATIVKPALEDAYLYLLKHEK